MATTNAFKVAELIRHLEYDSANDVITTGKSALECSEIIKINKSNLLGYCCIIDRSSEKIFIKNKIISQIKLKIDTFNDSNLPEELKKTQPTKPGTRNISK